MVVVLLLPLASTFFEMHAQRYTLGKDPPVCRSCIGAVQKGMRESIQKQRDRTDHKG